MALGDGENDVEMLQLVGWGVAVANAGNKAKQAANAVLEVSNDQGAVGVAIERFVCD
jgi:hydroxymethylpyrimidine pyrophosphatase-like HAD family hydrolase